MHQLFPHASLARALPGRLLAGHDVDAAPSGRGHAELAGLEAAVGAVGGDFSVKLEDQVLITEDGYENLTTYPFDAALMGQ